MSQRFIQNPWLSDVFTTTNATITSSTTAIYAPPSGSTGYVEITILARNTSTGAVGVSKIAQSFKNIAGTVSLAGSLISIVGVAGALVGDLTTAIAGLIVVSTATITPQVTGIVATNIEWLIDARYWVN